MFKVIIKANLKSLNDFVNFKKDIEHDVIQNGLDETLDKSVDELKEEIQNILSETAVEVLSKGDFADEDSSTATSISLTKEALLKFTTGADIRRWNRAKMGQDVVDSKLVVANDFKKGTDKSYHGISYSLETYSFDREYALAVKHFNESVFMFVDSSGNQNYFVNPGIKIDQFIKIKCSTDTGDTDKSRKRWEQHKDRHGVAEWTLTAAGVDYIKSAFINYTGVLNALELGRFDDASRLLEYEGGNTDKLQKKIEQLKFKKNLTPEAEITSTFITLINNLRIEKTITEDRTAYKLISTYGENIHNPEFIALYDDFRAEVDAWAAINEDPWFYELLNKIVEVITKYESKNI